MSATRTAAGTFAPAPAHLSLADKAAYYTGIAAQLGAPQRPAKQAGPKAVPAAIVYYEVRWWLAGKKRATLNSSPTTTAAFAQRSAAHYAKVGYESEAVSVDVDGRKKVL